MKRFLMAVALSCALSATALAGNVPSTDVAPPTPTPENAQTTLPGNIPTSDYAPPPEESHLLTVLLTIIGVL